MQYIVGKLRWLNKHSVISYLIQLESDGGPKEDLAPQDSVPFHRKSGMATQPLKVSNVDRNDMGSLSSVALEG